MDSNCAAHSRLRTLYGGMERRSGACHLPHSTFEDGSSAMTDLRSSRFRSGVQGLWAIGWLAGWLAGHRSNALLASESMRFVLLAAVLRNAITSSKPDRHTHDHLPRD